MRKVIRLVASLAIGSSAALAPSSVDAQSLPRVTIAVVEAAAFGPIDRATISIDGRLQPAATDSTGIFRLAAIKPGTHLFRVRKIGYAEMFASADVGGPIRRRF